MRWSGQVEAGEHPIPPGQVCPSATSSRIALEPCDSPAIEYTDSTPIATRSEGDRELSSGRIGVHEAELSRIGRIDIEHRERVGSGIHREDLGAGDDHRAITVEWIGLSPQSVEGSAAWGGDVRGSRKGRDR